MAQLIMVGNFKELGYGDTQEPTLKEHISPTPQEHEEQIISYLQHGLLCAAVPGVARDVLAGTREVIAIPHVWTDGVWMWRGDLVYYVEHYHYRLPEAFIRHMQSRNWQPPQEHELDMVELSRRNRHK